MTDEPASAAPAAGGAPAERTTPLTAPREGTPPTVATADGVADLVARFAAGIGPVALDAERASGYRYSQRAYLVQLRREGAGTALIDPMGVPDLAGLDAAIADAEWVLHAASQDLPCLADLGLRPRRLFDTELAARIAGLERVGLASLTENLLGYSLEKHHSAADWSTRPLPESWLVYAALDVELLVDLRDALAENLREQGKQEWAAEEFAAVVRWGGQPPKPRVEQWRRTSGVHRLRGPRAQARVRAMWTARDDLARRRDTAPGRVLPDAALVAAAEADPADERALLAIPGFNGRATRRLAKVWLDALAEARALPDSALPGPPTNDGPPPPHRWAERDPAAAARLARCRQAITTTATALNLPPENLTSPDSIRRLAWTPPGEITRDTVAAELRGLGAREWQVKLVAADLAVALAALD
ncbi:3'-5' exonuclease [Pilimelia anulata]|uniref:3'-5' exonuclease n=1 Tax=Pilimelia anulata TaxID=53371 RepID=A0A8J3AZT3_9ACTN|nr:HRDC domain-containing protein [Pilimelia anulata]GGJ77990.1 3'-5' exonuclease [Pilimelia anulata]